MAPCGSTYTKTPLPATSLSSNSMPLKSWSMLLISPLLLLAAKGPVVLAEKADKYLSLSVAYVLLWEVDVPSELESLSMRVGGFWT